MRINSIKFSEGQKPDPSGAKDARGYTKYVPCTMASIEASPTYSSDPNDENKKFWDASPGGKFEINCVNAAATAELKIGQEYYFDIHPVKPDAAAAAPTIGIVG
jgi:hypothetical protein